LRILFDHNVDRRFRRHLPRHHVRTAREMGWDKLANGALLQAAADDGFDALLTLDKNLQHQQNLQTLPLPVIVLSSPSNALPALLPFAAPVLQLLEAPLKRQLYLIQSASGV
jgi:hypothetical protein